jgi:hypothetical protein
MTTRVLLLVGTRKGAFIYRSDERRRCWQPSEPMLEGWQVFHMAADTRRDPPRLYAAASNPWWGRALARSDDGGATWELRSPGLSFPAEMGISVETIWSVRPGHPREPGVVYAGTAPTGLFRSEDWGETWAPLESILRHPLRSYWAWIPEGRAPLHSIDVDPRDPARLYIAISGGGAYMSEDRGATWRMISHHAVAVTPEAGAHHLDHPIHTSPEARAYISQTAANVPAYLDPATVFDMHRMRLDPKRPDRLWAQAHTGVFRSDDRGLTWEDVTPGLPSFHGFPIAVTKRGPDAAFVVPLKADEFRVARGQLAVYRTRDGGASWEPLTNGLPGPYDYQSIYREGLDTDGLEPEGVYAGTSNGQLFASASGGDCWQRLPGTLPPILSVTAAVV